MANGRILLNQRNVPRGVRHVIFENYRTRATVMQCSDIITPVAHDVQ